MSAPRRRATEADLEFFDNVRFGEIDEVKAALSNGQNVNVQDDFDKVPLLLSLIRCSFEFSPLHSSAFSITFSSNCLGSSSLFSVLPLSFGFVSVSLSLSSLL